MGRTPDLENQFPRMRVEDACVFLKTIFPTPTMVEKNHEL